MAFNEILLGNIRGATGATGATGGAGAAGARYVHHLLIQYQSSSSNSFHSMYIRCMFIDDSAEPIYSFGALCERLSLLAPVYEHQTIGSYSNQAVRVGAEVAAGGSVRAFHSNHLDRLDWDVVSVRGRYFQSAGASLREFTVRVFYPPGSSWDIVVNTPDYGFFDDRVHAL